MRDLMNLVAQSFLLSGCMAAMTGLEDGGTRMLTQPAISDTHLVFAYAEDLWICLHDGSEVHPLTTHEGIESDPTFSPDGKTVAFSGQYDGNVDVYVVDVSGGAPRRLTWHPVEDQVQCFTPDGSAVVFTSRRNGIHGSVQQLFEVSVTGGHPTQLPIPSVTRASYSADGNKIAYVPLREAFSQWKNYRGGTHSRIFLYDRHSHAVEPIPQPQGRCNDVDPMWQGETVWFRSDRDGEFNLYTFDPATRKVEAVTLFGEFPVLSAAMGRSNVVFEQEGYLHRIDLQTRRVTPLTLTVPADHIELRPRFISGNQYIREASLSPGAARVAFEYRGEIITVPAKKGDPRNLTQTTGVHERSPVWSPDGKSIAYVSDESGEYEIHVAAHDGAGEVRKFQMSGAGFYDRLQFSPDSRKISFTDNSWSLYVLDLDSGETRKLSTEPVYGPIKLMHHHWSPDSRWIAYIRGTHAQQNQLHLYSVEEDRSFAITDGLSDVVEPCFDKNGKYLYLAAATDAGPVRDWFSMSNADMRMSQALYVVVLKKDEPSPFAPESDEEGTEKEEEKKDAAKEEENKKSEAKEDKKAGEGGATEKSKVAGEEASSDELVAEGKKEDAAAKTKVVIDIEGLSQRILAMPVPAGFYPEVRPGNDGQLYYLRTDQAQGLFGGVFGGNVSANLYRFDMKERKEEKLGDGLSGFQVSADGSKLLVVQGETFAIVPAGPGIQPSSGKLAIEKMSVKIDPRSEWEQIYREAWRINRDYFYATNYHGCDWPAMQDRYRPFLAHVAARSDLNRVIQWMCSELAVGHHYLFGGDSLYTAKTVPVGLVGADYEVDSGRYRFKKVYGGLNWNPELRAPLTEPGVDVRAGEYLLEVDGKDLMAPEEIYGRFENAVGRQVSLKVGPNADGTGARVVKVVPIADETALRNRDWVEGNLERVTEATQGRVAYVYVPNTSDMGHTYFKRYFFPQADREAIIVDERYNGGGQVADYYIDILRRPELCHWATRFGEDFKTPLMSIQGPKVMLINESAGSGGDLLPWMFHKLELGTLVGRPTWGGLVGILGFPILMDGGFITSPNLAIWTEDGFIVENVGVPPDVEVEILPADVVAGRDSQLEKAIELVLAELPPEPRQRQQRPPFPERAKR